MENASSRLVTWRSMMRQALRLALVLGCASALSAYDRLAGVRLTSVAQRAPVTLTEQWSGDERVVVEFLRHFG